MSQEYPDGTRWFGLEVGDGSAWKAAEYGGKKWWRPKAADPGEIATRIGSGIYRVVFAAEDRRKRIGEGLAFELQVEDAPDTAPNPPAPAARRPIPPAVSAPAPAQLAPDHPTAQFCLLHATMRADTQILIEAMRISAQRDQQMMGVFFDQSRRAAERHMLEVKGLFLTLADKREEAARLTAAVERAQSAPAAAALDALAKELAELKAERDEDDAEDDPTKIGEDQSFQDIVTGVGSHLAKSFGMGVAEHFIRKAAEHGLINLPGVGPAAQGVAEAAVG